MKTGSATGHANHDESLVVRLYGNDVGPEERSRALDLVAGCEECAALFADLGQIAWATAARPTPARPREFTLTAADAARLRPEPQARGRSLWRGLTRSLGGAFAALGLAGILIAGATTTFAPAAQPASLPYSNSQEDQAGNQNALGAGLVPPSAQPNAAAESAGTGSAASSSDATKLAAVPPAASFGESASLAVRQPVSSPSATRQGVGAAPLSPAQPSSGGSVDTRLVVLIVSAGLLLIGLLLLFGPRLRSRRIRS
ncbi:MAG TPA: hypothetical protein VIK06_00100 [Candidatus Limnocylindrales bacterium]